MNGIGPRSTRVTIVVPTFRRPELLRACVTGCGRQVLDESIAVEIVVVDNCPDGSARPVIDSLADRSACPVRYVSEVVPGISAARNAGLSHASGEFVAFVDDDEVPGPNWLSCLVDTARRFEADAVLGPVTPLNPLRGEVTPAWPPTGTVLGSTTVSPFWSRAGKAFPRLATNNVLLRITSRSIEGVRFDHRLGLTGGEDTVYFNTIIGGGAKLVSCAEAIVHEHVGSERLTLRYALARSFRGGQIVSWAPMLAEPPSPILTSTSMIVGLAQVPTFLLLAAVGCFSGRHKRDRHLGRAAAALGKLFWAAPFRAQAYGASS